MNFFNTNPTVSQAQKEVKPLLTDEGCQVLSTFDLNKIASLTYGDMVCDELFELIEQIVSHPMDYTPLTTQKTLVVLNHILIYGSSKCVNSGYGIGRFVESLTTFNTVLAAREKQGATAFFQRLQGGGVDRGGPIREAATEVHKLLSNINNLQRIRNEKASKESLVPIGDDKIAFITDDVRHFILKQRIEEQQRIHIKSNLAKSEGGFGGGYNAKDGRNVVGAAHGIEEMIKMAQLEKKKFSDDSKNSGMTPEEKILMELAAEAKMEKERAEAEAAAARNEDLLTSFNPMEQPNTAGSADLLDFGSTLEAPTTAVPSMGDLLGDFGGTSTSTSTTDNIFDLAPAPQQPPQGMRETSLLDLAPSFSTGYGQSSSSTADPFGLATLATPSQPVDPFSAMVPPAMTNQQPGQSPSPADSHLGGMVSMMNSVTIADKVPPTKSVMSSNVDRFAALDALAVSSSQSLGSNTSDVSKPQMMSPPPIPSSSPPQPPPSMPPSYPPSTLGGTSEYSTMVIPGSGKVAAAYGDSDDSDNPWVMGGSTGAGLQPMGAAPAAPPPPPPPS